MKTTETLNQLSSLLNLADKQASASAFNLNTLDMRMTVDVKVQEQIDLETSGIKSVIGHILQAKELVKELRSAPNTDQLVYLWLINGEGTDHEIDFETKLFVWPFPSLPHPGDKIETQSVIRNIFPELPELFLHADFYKMLYSFFEVNSEGKYYQCLKMVSC